MILSRSARTLKQGLVTPGMHIPVVPEAEITTRRPDYTLLLAWNYADDIVGRHAAYTSAPEVASFTRSRRARVYETAT